MGLRFELFEGSNQKEERRILIFGKRTPVKEGKESPPLLLAEMFPVPETTAPKRPRRKARETKDQKAARLKLEKEKKRKKVDSSCRVWHVGL